MPLRLPIIRALIATLLLVVVGGGWQGVQALIWLEMIGDRTSELGFRKAVETTVSGKAPCSRCIAFQQVREKNQQESGGMPEQVRELKPNVDRLLRFVAEPGVRRLPFVAQRDQQGRVFVDEVALPPPRWV